MARRAEPETAPPLAINALNYYNENDPKAAQWLRDLIWAGAISDGEVDTRSIEDVTPNDLSGYTQCHFFAGIGGWSLALRLAGWPDTKPVWTGSCPCQPFSAAGKSGGFDDERHLWPAFFHLIETQRPPVVFGEQVASPDGLAWLDLVQTDLEAAHYAVGAVDLCAAGVGAPHIRQRLYWLGHSNRAGLQTRRSVAISGEAGPKLLNESGTSNVRLADTMSAGRAEWGTGAGVGQTPGSGSAGRLGEPQSEQPHGSRDARSGRGEPADAGNMGDTHNEGSQGWGQRRHGADKWPTWAASLVDCRDGKRRPVEPGTFPLAHGVSGRVGLLRGYGNAIVPQVAAEFIGAYLDTI